jgi:hypothetical protein
MELKDQVVTISNSKKLKEIGVNKESHFHWCCFAGEYSLFTPKTTVDDMNGPSDVWLLNDLKERDMAFSAFTASELLDILPYMVDSKNNVPFNYYRLRIEKSFIVDTVYLKQTPIYIINYYCDTTDTAGNNAWMARSFTKNIYGTNLADACATMLIFLIENKFMEE